MSRNKQKKNYSKIVSFSPYMVSHKCPLCSLNNFIFERPSGMILMGHWWLMMQTIGAVAKIEHRMMV